MKILEERIRKQLTEALSPEYLDVENESYKHHVPSGSETHFRVLVVSERFEDKSRLERQRLVNQILAAELRDGVHALAQKTMTPPEWAKAQAEVDFESPECLGGYRSNLEKR